MHQQIPELKANWGKWKRDTSASYVFFSPNLWKQSFNHGPSHLTPKQWANNELKTKRHCAINEISGAKPGCYAGDLCYPSQCSLTIQAPPPAMTKIKRKDMRAITADGFAYLELFKLRHVNGQDHC